MSRFDTVELEVCEICTYLLTYGEYNDGETTAEDKRAAWEKSGYGDMIRHMSHSCADCDSLGFTLSACDLCGTRGGELHDVTAFIPRSS